MGENLMVDAWESIHNLAIIGRISAAFRIGWREISLLYIYPICILCSVAYSSSEHAAFFGFSSFSPFSSRLGRETGSTPG